ncbi:LytR/AlgR family response regulator transcription factor [Inhella gelatinilytica]|uniref:Response regulator transcription factor n=1 Tax=Inhella gelatinilytica TaxID=2795030 RepID=A0A931IVB0_9BURK|nr:LytTR family DNA-binding domain-containing protein [Inhella gelatinilytica]MBH9553450.1 response regulator transcription factor [Inhella gelatinilytica]
MLIEAPLRVLIADDEPLARARLASLLEGCRDPHAQVLASLASATAVQTWLQDHGCDLLLLDIQMPGDGLALAADLKQRADAPAVVFVTAHAQHALDAFGLNAVDYLTKPVRQERLQAALTRVAQRLREREALARVAALESPPDEVLQIHERGRLVRVPVGEVIYVKAELKYLTVRTPEQRYVMDGSLNDLEHRMGHRFLRIHRNTLVAKNAVRELARRAEPEAGSETEGEIQESWAVRVAPVQEWLPVSRRQLSAVREAIGAGD